MVSSRWPLGYRVSWHPRIIQWFFQDPLEFDPPEAQDRVRYTTEFGLSIGINPPINVLGYDFRQGGIAYERGDNINAIKL